MQQHKGAKAGVERPIKTALIVRPVISEDLRHDLTEIGVRRSEAGFELALPEGALVSGSGLAVYGPQPALDPGSLCQDLVEELLDRAFNGETGAVLAMGQTGSGKSRLMGTECNRRPTAVGASGGRSEEGGPWPNSVGQYVPRRLFELAAQRQIAQQLEAFEVECAMVEVYSQKHHDAVRDLLAIGRPQIDRPAAPLKHLQWFPAPDAQELQAKLLEGADARETGRTLGNNRSSRSHAIFMIRMSQTRREEGGILQRVTAQLMLVDLAGSEQAALAAASTTTFKEGAGINLGLLSLGGVIEDLARGNPPQYNDCALTRILKPALGGNANAVIVGCISPLVAHLEYTKRTLLYISKAGTIKNTVRADVQSLRRAEEERAAAEVAELRAQLEALRLAAADKAKASASPDTVVLSRAEYQRLVQQAESERLRADSLDTMLRHVSARLAGAGQGAMAPAAVAAASAAAQGVAVAELGQEGAAAAASPGSDGATGQQQGRQPQAGPSSPPAAGAGSPPPPPPGAYPYHLSALASPVFTLTAVEGSAVVAAAQESGSDEECGIAAAGIAAAGEAAGLEPLLEGWSMGEACLERESNLQPEQLDLLKVSLDQEQRSLRRKRAQQARQALGPSIAPALQQRHPQRQEVGSMPPMLPPPGPPYEASAVRAWAQRAAEERSSSVGWQYVVDSLQHELGYLRLRLNSASQPSASAGAGADVAGAEQLPRLEAELAEAEAQLAEAQHAQRAAEAGMREDPAALLGWLGGAGGDAPAGRVAAALLAELIECRLQARQLERQLFQQRLATASLELSLRTYNHCLGETERELDDAAAEIQVLRAEREEFKQAIEEKMRYVQQAAAAQNALERLHTQVAQLEKELAAAREAALHPQPSPSRSFTSAIMSWATLGRSPAPGSQPASQGSHSRHASPDRLPGSRGHSLPGSPRVSIGGGGGATPLGSHPSSPARRTYPGSPRTSIGSGQPAQQQQQQQQQQQSPLGRLSWRALEEMPLEGSQQQAQQEPQPRSARQQLWDSLQQESGPGGGGGAPQSLGELP